MLWTAEWDEDRRVFHGFAWVEVVLPLARALEQWLLRLKWSGLGVNGKWLSGDKMCKYCLLKIWFWRGVKDEAEGLDSREWERDCCFRRGEENWRGEDLLGEKGVRPWVPLERLGFSRRRDTSSPHIVMKKHARGFRLHLMISVVRLQDISCEGGREGSSWEERRGRKELVSRAVYRPRSCKKQMPIWV